MFSKYSHISKPVPQMLPHYDVVVVGSGYGGGIAASRMARAGKRVVLLERGKERWPGEYPEHTAACVPEIHVSKNDKDYGNPRGMFRIYLGDEQDAVVCNGLGGTSLINANVALKADELVWKQNVWPKEIKQHEIEEGYKRAEYMLQPQPYPKDWPELPKLKTLEEQAVRLGFQDHFYRPPITVTFKNGVNNAGVYQRKSTLTGNDATGVNDGSKNSTLMNYIPDAWNHGAEIFCEVEVRRIKYSKKTKKYIIFYQWLGDQRCKFEKEYRVSQLFVLADMVFVAAGTLGTNEIMLRSKASGGLKISDNLGKGFTGNGDILGFGYNMNRKVNGIAMGYRDSNTFKDKVGPCITGVMDMRHNVENVMDGYVIEEGSCPNATANFLKGMLVLGESTWGKKPKNLTIMERFGKRWRQFRSTFGGIYSGALGNTQVYLIMSHDDAKGEFSFKQDRLQMGFRGVGRTRQIEHLNDTLAKATNELGGTYVPDPIWTKVFKNSLVTVHPLGGCIIGKDARSGVVNHKGQVFIGNEGTDVYEGLYICDGAIVPMALGVNPFFTICALAERICQKAADDRGWNIDLEPHKKPIDFAKPEITHSTPKEFDERTRRRFDADKGGLWFSEYMSGHFSTEITDTSIGEEAYYMADIQAKTANSTMSFLLSITAYDAETITQEENNAADIFGTVTCRALSSEPLIITMGCFRLLLDDHGRAGVCKMLYMLDMMSTEGQFYSFEGYKVISSTLFYKGFKETTTLYASVKEKSTGTVVGLGILHISPKGFASQVGSIQATSDSYGQRLSVYYKFIKYFWNRLTSHYWPIFLPLQYPGDFSPIKPFAVPRPTEYYTSIAEDGVESQLIRYKGNGRSHHLKGPILLIHGAAMTHEIWTTNLIEHSIVTDLIDLNYDLWFVDYRLSPNNKASREQYSIDPARLDIAAAVEKIRNVTKVEKIGIIAHCVGSLVVFMGLLDGTITGVGSVVSSQMAMHPQIKFPNSIRPHLGLGYVWKYICRQDFYDVRTSANTDWFNWTCNQLHRFNWVGSGQLCRSAVCHRATFGYGLLWRHENLNEQAHDHCYDFFSYLNMTAFLHLLKMALKKKIVDNNGRNVYLTRENVKRLNFPITLIHGGLNAVFDTLSSKRSYDLLIETNGPELYKYYKIDGYGHLDTWWGNKAHQDVFYRVTDHFEATKGYFGYRPGHFDKLEASAADVIHNASSKIGNVIHSGSSSHNAQ